MGGGREWRLDGEERAMLVRLWGEVGKFSKGVK